VPDLERAVAVLTGPELSPICEMAVYRQDGWVTARSVDGCVRFRTVSNGTGGWDVEIDDVDGRNPLGIQDPSAFATLEDEKAHLFPERAENSYPHAYESLAHVFEHPCAPDIAAVHTAAHNWEEEGGHRGEHGSLDVIQSRAPLILSGTGIERQGRIARSSRLVNVAPTILSWLGATPRPGRRLDGSPGPTLLARQDGDREDDLLTGEKPESVVAFLLDGTNPNLMHSMIDRALLPHLGRLAGDGVDFQWGAMASFPTVTLANHTAILTGCHSGHHGVLHNAYYRREGAEQIITNQPAAWPWARNWLNVDVETIHEAVHAHEPGAFTVSINEPTDRGADLSTFDTLRRGEWPGFEIDRIPPHGTERFVRPYKDYRWAARSDHSAVMQIRDVCSSRGRPRFLWVNFTLLDSASHRGGPHSDMAEAALIETDARVGDVIAALHDAGWGERTGYVVVADHGMEETNPQVTGDWSAALRDDGIVHRDEAYGFIYLEQA
jgi:hypothetical protein